MNTRLLPLPLSFLIMTLYSSESTLPLNKSAYDTSYSAEKYTVTTLYNRHFNSNLHYWWYEPFKALWMLHSENLVNDPSIHYNMLSVSEQENYLSQLNTTCTIKIITNTIVNRIIAFIGYTTSTATINFLYIEDESYKQIGTKLIQAAIANIKYRSKLEEIKIGVTLRPHLNIQNNALFLTPLIIDLFKQEGFSFTTQANCLVGTINKKKSLQVARKYKTNNVVLSTYDMQSLEEYSAALFPKTNENQYNIIKEYETTNDYSLLKQMFFDHWNYLTGNKNIHSTSEIEIERKKEEYIKQLLHNNTIKVIRDRNNNSLLAFVIYTIGKNNVEKGFFPYGRINHICSEGRARGEKGYAHLLLTYAIDDLKYNISKMYPLSITHFLSFRNNVLLGHRLPPSHFNKFFISTSCCYDNKNAIKFFKDHNFRFDKKGHKMLHDGFLTNLIEGKIEIEKDIPEEFKQKLQEIDIRDEIT